MAQNFGAIHYYGINYALADAMNLHIINTYGVRTFWALQQKNEIKYEPNWADRMFRVEMKVADVETFKAIAFFHHVILQKEENQNYK